VDHEIEVKVVEYADRSHYLMAYKCPVSRRRKWKSTEVLRDGTKKARTEAERVAAKWEAELREGRYHATGRITWEDFRERYESEVLPNRSAETGRKVLTAFALVEQILRPRRLSELTSEAISRWMIKVKQENDRTEATVAVYCRHLRATLAWAFDLGLITIMPKMRIPRQGAGEKLMKGRPILGEEHERMLMAVGKVASGPRVAAWQQFLEGLWWSGLRISEALALSWDATSDVYVVDVPGSHPVVRFRTAGQKARREEVWPCPPEFVRLLAGIPEADRIGRVFKVGVASGSAGRTVSAIGRAAKVFVDEAAGKPATAHDYRRAFGTRWAKRVMPATLKRLMRHKEIDTTLKYYVHSEAEDIAADLWSAMRKAESSNTSGNRAAENCDFQAVSRD
jgi:integrase